MGGVVGLKTGGQFDTPPLLGLLKAIIGFLKGLRADFGGLGRVWGGFGEGSGVFWWGFGGVWKLLQWMRVDLSRVLARRPQRLPKLRAFEIPDARLIMLRLQTPVKRG